MRIAEFRESSDPWTRQLVEELSLTIMTSLLTQFKESLCNSLTTQPESVKDLIAQQQKPTSLLAKRSELNDFEDLLVKKHKTQSTQASETNSDNQSVTSRDNFGGADFAILACSETFEEDSQACSILGTPRRQLSEENTESTSALQQALRTLELKIKMHDEQSKIKEIAFAGHRAAYSIPVFQETAEFALRVAADLSIKSDTKKMEEEIEVTYGAVEFPFLSFSATLNDLVNIRNGTYQFPAMEGTKQEVAEKKETSRGENVKKIFKVEKVDKLKKQAKDIKMKITEKSQKEKITKEKVESRKKKVETEVLEAISKKLEQKRKSKLKSIEEARKSGKIEIEEPKLQGTKSHVSPFAFARRKFLRKKNKWQVEQDEKLAGLSIQRQVSCEAYSFMFEGSKKKSGLIPVGSEFQVEVPQFTIPDRKSENRRAPKTKWSPAEHSEIELHKFFETVEGLSDSIINEEAAIDLVLKNNNDLKKTMKYIKSNKSKALKTLVFKPSK